MNNFERIKNMSTEEFINEIITGIFGDWNINTVINWLKQDEIDWTKIPKDTKVFVKNKENEYWKPRYFSRYEHNMKSPYLVFRDGATSWTNEGKPLETYEYCELANEKEISIKDILEERCINCASYEFCEVNKTRKTIKCISKYIEDNFNISRKESNDE